MIIILLTCGHYLKTDGPTAWWLDQQRYRVDIVCHRTQPAHESYVERVLQASLGDVPLWLEVRP